MQQTQPVQKRPRSLTVVAVVLLLLGGFALIGGVVHLLFGVGGLVSFSGTDVNLQNLANALGDLFTVEGLILLVAAVGGAARCQLGVEAERRDRLGGHNHERPGPCIGVGGGPPRAGGEPRASLFPGQDKDKGLLQTQADRDGSNDAGFLIRVLWGVELRVFGSTKRQSIGVAESVFLVS